MQLNLSEIEQGIKAAITALNRPYITAVKTYGGEFDVNLKDVVRRFPAVWTTFQGSGKPVQLSARKFRVPLIFVTLVGAYSLRNEEATRHGVDGDTGEMFSIGSFQLLQDVQRALLNNDLSRHGVQGIAPLELGKIDKIFDTRTQEHGISIMAQHWHTSCVITQSVADWDADADADWMQIVNVDYLFKPQDDIKDASDIVHLEHD